jgi:hypothetical protein
METADQDWSFSRLMEGLQSKYTDSPKQGSSLRDLGNPRHTLEKMILHEWSQGIPSYIALDIASYLRTLHVPSKLLETYFQHIPTALEWLSPDQRWIQLALSMAVPFQTEHAIHVRDLRPPSPRRLPYRNLVGLPCRDRVKLISVLTDALFFYEIHIRIAQGTGLGHDIATDLYAGLTGLKLAEPLMLTLHQQGRLPAAFKGAHVNTIKAVMKTMRTYLHALLSESDTLFPLVPPAYVRDQYHQLLAAMKTAFRDYGPREKYPDQAISYALSAILTPLLRRAVLSLDPRCTTPGAISHRLTLPRATSF